MRQDLPYPKIHEREQRVYDAELELRGAILDIRKKHDLTLAEYVRMLNSVFYDSLGSVVRLWIRDERHGNNDTPGGLAE